MAGIAFLFALVLTSIITIELKKEILLYHHLYMTVLRKRSDLCHPDRSVQIKKKSQELSRNGGTWMI